MDLLRGLCLISMTINHLPAMSLHRFSYEPLGYFTSANGFVLISGITCGLVYGGGGAVQTKRILRRCGYVAFTYALLTLILSIASAASRFTSWRDLASGIILEVGSDRAAILLIYVAFLLALPLVLHQFHAGHVWRLLCASFGLWLLAQWGIGPQVGPFYLLAWQFLFVSGVWVGYAGRHGVPIPGLSSKAALKVVAAGSMAFFFLRHPLVHHPILSLGWEITSGGKLGIVRLLNIAVFAFLIARIPRSLDKQWADLSIFRALSFLGRHSLQVFSWHVLVLWACHLYTEQWTGAVWSLQIVMTGIVISTLFVPAFLHEQWQTHSRGRSGVLKKFAASASPAPRISRALFHSWCWRM